LVGCRFGSFSVSVIFHQASTKAKTAQKPVKSKAPVSKTNPKSASNKKVLVDHNKNAEDTPIGEEDASDNDQFGASSSNLQAIAPIKKKKTASETYTKVGYSPISLV
jgi:DNA topoisomerase II